MQPDGLQLITRTKLGVEYYTKIFLDQTNINSSMGRVPGSAKTKATSMIRFRYLFLLTTILVGGSFLLTSNEGFDMVFFAYKTQRIDSVRAANSEEWFTISTEGCTIPALDPLDITVKSFVEYPSKVSNCPDTNNSLLGSDRNKIWVKYDTLQYYKINTTDMLSCCYQSFYRPAAVKNVESKKIDDRSIYSLCTHFDDVITVNNEFVRVTCFLLKNPKKIMYEQFFAFAPKKQFKKHGRVPEITADQNKIAYNIVVLGIDAVSRLNFHRTMPKTAHYLRKKGAVEFMGYNKVGDNTFPNLIPMLMGLKVSELKKTCYPYDTATFDNCPFIWEWFKQAGYYTALGEDTAHLGTFNYAKTGFSIAPTDYYLHTFMTEAIKHVGAHKDFNCYLCMHDTYFFKVLLNYVEDLTWSLTNSKLFGFFWEVSMSHDYLNYPMKMDDDYLKLLIKLETSGYLDKTIIIVVSDHGIRWGDIRFTKQGRLEERLPLLYILPPHSFRNNYKEAYNNLNINSKRLTTPFDVHATLNDLIDLTKLENNAIAKRRKQNYAKERGISLFLPIPENRTCKVADIDGHWCTCHKEVALTKDNPQAFEVAKTLVLLINVMLKEYPQCARLALSEVISATEIKADEMELGKASASTSSWKEFMVAVKTVPGGGMFEATLRQNADDLSWKLLGTPSRLNLYGDQSRCVDQYQMKLYCYCS